MKSIFYKFCYWIGVKFGIHRLESWAYLNWFKTAAANFTVSYFEFAGDYFKFCKKWGIGNSFGK